MKKVLEVFSQLRIRAQVDDIWIHIRDKGRKLVDEVPQIFLKQKHRVNTVKLDLSLTKEAVEEKSGSSKQRLQQFCKEEEISRS